MHEPSGQTNVLTLVIPCYNEEATLRHCVERVLELRGDDLELDVIIVDDCSKDSSLQIAQGLEKEHDCIRVAAHERNRGKGAALRTGFSLANGDYVGVQDADLEYNPLELKRLLQPLCDGRADVVFGSRYLSANPRRVLSYWHTMMNKGLTVLSNMFTNLDLTDMETCYKLFKREVIQAVELKEDRFGFEPEIVAKLARMRVEIYEMAISYTGRTFAEGKKINWKDGLRALYCILHYSASTASLPVQSLVYLFIGGASAVLNLLLFTLLTGLGLSVIPAATAAYVAAAAGNYLLCISILFRHRAYWNTWGELLVYGLVVALTGVMDVMTTSVLVAGGMSPFSSKALACLLVLVANFLGRRYLVFPEQSVSRD